METNLLYAHKEVEHSFFQAFEKRPHHAWILKGPKGIGKLDFAKKIAGQLLTQETPDSHIQNKIEAQNHPSFLYISLEDSDLQSISIEQIRKIFHFVTQTTEGWKVIILNSLNDLTVNGSNGLLKVLESPPPKTVFFLIHHNGVSLLPTITSRCAALSFAPLPEEELSSQLPSSLTEAERKILLSLAQGCAHRLTDLTDHHALSLYDSFLETLQSLLHKDDESPLSAFIGKIGRDKTKLSLFLLIVERWLQGSIKEAALREENPLFLREPYSLETLLKTHQAVSHLIISDKKLMLDARQLMLTIFFELKNLRTS
jgi:DNA polymerase-3 subunit delta'